MKVIDEKGKLFGKLNIIDLLVLIIVIAAVAVIGVKFLGGGSDEKSASGTQVTYTVRMTAQNANVVEYLAEYVDAASGKRDQLVAGSSLVDAYLVDYWTEPTAYNRTVTGSVELLDEVDAEEAGLVDICFVIEANVGSTTTNKVGSQEVRIGRSHIVKTTHFEFDCGFIESCIWETVE